MFSLKKYIPRLLACQSKYDINPAQMKYIKRHEVIDFLVWFQILSRGSSFVSICLHSFFNLEHLVILLYTPIISKKKRFLHFLFNLNTFNTFKDLWSVSESFNLNILMIWFKINRHHKNTCSYLITWLSDLKIFSAFLQLLTKRQFIAQ